MAQTNNISNITIIQELSIQISLSGLSFCILQKDSNTISCIKHIAFEKKLNPLEALDQLKHVFNTEDALKSSFNAVYVIHVNELSTLVPKALFNEDSLADYLKFNSKILKSDFITYDTISINDSVNVYVPYININNFIYDMYGSFTYKHVSTVLIENILLIEKHIEDLKVYAHISSNHFEIIVTKKGGLLLYNTFEYTTTEDFIYYLLFTTEQLQLNPETLQLIFIGNIVKDDELYKMAYKYIRHISFGNRFDNYSYTTQAKTNYSDFTLIKNF
tara:strand:+ start:1085 stop:1906 length:822 start_codon:yes stop_codon:yes gene_type:complete